MLNVRGEMAIEYPPLSDEKLEQLQKNLRLCPSRYRDDALQEAWLAHLEGRDPAAAVSNFVRGERRHELREVSASQTARGRL